MISMRKPSMLLPIALVVGCAVADNGAVELSWAFRPASSALPDKFVDCNANGEPGTHPIDTVALDWAVEGETGTFEWPCGGFTGATGFVVPVGDATLTVRPVCAGGIPLDPASVRAPATIVRGVTKADVVSLGAVQIVVQVSSCLEQPCICHDP